MIEQVPSLSLADAWEMPWFETLDLMDAAAVRADLRGGGGGGQVCDVGPRRVMSNGKLHAPGVSKLMNLCGL